MFKAADPTISVGEKILWLKGMVGVVCLCRVGLSELQRQIDLVRKWLLLLLLLLLSLGSRVRLCATPSTAAHQAPPSVGFSRQEYWSGVPLLGVLEMFFSSVWLMVTVMNTYVNS